MQNKPGHSWTFILTKAKLTERVSALLTAVPPHAGCGWHWTGLSIGTYLPNEKCLDEQMNDTKGGDLQQSCKTGLLRGDLQPRQDCSDTDGHLFLFLQNNE